MGESTIRTYREFRARFFPAEEERRRRAAMSPEDIGREIARDALRAAGDTTTREGA